MRKFDIDLCDETGQVRVRMHGFATRSAHRAQPPRTGMAAQDTFMLTPVWDTVALDPTQPAFPAASHHILMVTPAGETTLSQALRQRYPGAETLMLEDGATIDTITAHLQALSAVDHLFWLAPPPSTERVTPGADALIDGQEYGVLQVFRIIKALLRTGYGDRAFALTALTTRSLAVYTSDEVDPTHAGLHGLIGSLAKEYPHWRIRCLDLDDLPTADAAARVVDDMVHLEPDPEGNTRAYRIQGEGRHAGQWFRQQLLPLTLPEATTSQYHRGGVYVVIGGAGGIGEVWSAYMMRTHGARIVWIGRRQKDQAIQAKLDRLAELGPAPLYLSADATDREALQRAYQAIKREHDAIHGLVRRHRLAGQEPGQYGRG
jgi:hypothetical protein